MIILHKNAQFVWLFSHIITKSKVYDLQDNLDCCTYHAVSQILQVNFLFTLPSIWNKWSSHLSENTTRNQLKNMSNLCTDCRNWFLYTCMWMWFVCPVFFNLFYLLSPYWFYESVWKPEVPPNTGRASNSLFKYTFISYPLSKNWNSNKTMFLICLGQYEDSSRYTAMPSSSFPTIIMYL